MVDFSLMAHFVLILQILAGKLQKRLQFLPFEGTVVTKQRIKFWILFWNHFTNDIPDRRFMHDASSHSTFRESFDFAMRRKRFLEVSHSNCLCHEQLGPSVSPSQRGLLTVRLGWDSERWSVLWDESGLIALLLFSAGSRTTFTQTRKKKAELEDNFFVFCLVRW